MMRALLGLLSLWPSLAAEEVCVDKSCKDAVPAAENMLFLHIPYNFGYTVGVAALFGHKVTSTWSVPEAWKRSEESGAQCRGYQDPKEAVSFPCS